MKKKKVVICSSASFEEKILEWKDRLEKHGFEVLKYPTKIKNDFLNSYNKEFSEHYNAITKADIVLALNFEKKGIAGYIGAGVFAEMAFALGLNRALNKKIEVCYINHISKNEMPYSDELALWQDLGWIKPFER
ncbi:MAG: hypothetical protein WC310_00640 [Patescibacteria group bacterium]|jgi:hypothetical protein